MSELPPLLPNLSAEPDDDVEVVEAHPSEPGTMGRRKAREQAMMAFYAHESQVDTPEALAAGLAVLDVGVEPGSLARDLLDFYREHAVAVDELLDANLTRWRLKDLGAVERAILRVCVCEFAVLHTDRPIVITEAIHLARRYARPESYKLLNGVLEKVAPIAEMLPLPRTSEGA